MITLFKGDLFHVLTYLPCKPEEGATPRVGQSHVIAGAAIIAGDVLTIDFENPAVLVKTKPATGLVAFREGSVAKLPTECGGTLWVSTMRFE